MKKLFLLLTISTFIFCGCSDDDKDNGPNICTKFAKL